jgi:hypothetical protein
MADELQATTTGDGTERNSVPWLPTTDMIFTYFVVSENECDTIKIINKSVTPN